MSGADLERALQAFARRRPFRPFLIELQSGDRFLISHPEAVARYGELFLYRGADRGQRVFAGASVCQLLDPPATPAGGPEITQEP
jgi:hypothetical protein